MNTEINLGLLPELLSLWPVGGWCSPNTNVIEVPVGNFHDKPLSSFRQPSFDPKKIPKCKPLKIPCFESTSHTQKRGKITENKVRESLKCLCA